eukprot:scaffold2790_cov143-Skeletonema_marinoi.AAC.3
MEFVALCKCRQHVRPQKRTNGKDDAQEQLQQEQERRRLAETVEQARNVSQGAGAGVQAVAGDGASIQNQMYAFMLDQAERMAKLEVKTAEANLDQTERMAKLEVKQKEDIVETRGMINKSNVDTSNLLVDISKLELGQERLKLGIAKNEVGQERLKLDIAKTDATANRAERKADKVNERVVLEDTVKKMTKSTAKRFPPKPVDDPLAHLTENASISPTHYGQAAAAADYRAAVDGSDDSFDEVEVPNNIITPYSTYSKTKVAFACANECFPIPAKDSAKKAPADAKKPVVAKKIDESSPPVTRTSTSSAKKSTALRRSGRISARRSEVKRC